MYYVDLYHPLNGPNEGFFMVITYFRPHSVDLFLSQGIARMPKLPIFNSFFIMPYQTLRMLLIPKQIFKSHNQWNIP